MVLISIVIRSSSKRDSGFALAMSLVIEYYESHDKVLRQVLLRLIISWSSSIDSSHNKLVIEY